jgi:phosphopantetheine--protein transferase-like protein
LEISYRKRQLDFRRKQISEWLDNEVALLKEETTEQEAEYYADRLSIIEKEARRQETEAFSLFGMLNGEGTDPNIAPLRRALAVWGLTIDDIGVSSFHGTSTKANDKNESNAFNTQFMHLGRSKGNACPVIAQKWLTGHPKGGAAAWMTNGMIQCIQDALIPGNRNADNISPEMRAFEYLVYPSRSIQTDGIKAGLLKSFGFGQVGGECLVIHPEYLLGTLDAGKYAAYKARNNERFDAAYRKFNDMFVHRNLVILKEAPPYAPELEQEVLLNPLARASKDVKGSYSFSKDMPVAKISAQAVHAAAQMTASSAGVYGVGTDVELISAIPINNETFLERNFTTGELDYCKKASDMQASLAGRWAAKEAVFKSLKTTSKGGGASMKDIEIVSSDKGPTVQLSGDAKRVADEAGIKSFEVSLSHADGVALAVAVAKN